MTFYELEKECKKRKRNRFLFWLFILVLITISFFVYYKFFYQHSLIKHIKQVKKEKLIKPKKIKREKNKTKILKPIIDLNVSNTNHKLNISFELPKIKINEVNVTINSIKKKQKKLINTSILPSYDTCIMLAKNYYKNGDYENALKWAKNANIQNKKAPMSWIIVAKSLYKMGQKDKAIKILKIYYDYTKNKKILEVIKKVKNGKI